VKPISGQSNRIAAFTIVELLTVISIIIILIGILVPGLNMAKRYARRVVQKNQFHAINVALEIFNNNWEGYPESSGGFGAVKLCDAVMGNDLLGYTPNPEDYNSPETSGRYAYLPRGSANVYKLKCLYNGRYSTRATDYRDSYVLCDVYKRIEYDNPDDPLHSMNGKKVGMPILYYKADKLGTTHSVKYPIPAPQHDSRVTPGDIKNIYKHADNDGLVQLGIPWPHAIPNIVHLMDPSNGTTLYPEKPNLATSNVQWFYNEIWNDRITAPGTWRPYNADSYILMSAGFNGDYGGDRSTGDDVFNFGD